MDRTDAKLCGQCRKRHQRGRRIIFTMVEKALDFISRFWSQRLNVGNV